MLKIIFFLNKLILIKIIFEIIKLISTILVKISKLIIYISNIINLYLLSHLKIKLYESKNKFSKIIQNKNLKKLKNKEFSQREQNELDEQNHSSWKDFDFNTILITVDSQSKRCQSTLNKLKNLDISPDIFLAKTPKDLTKFLTSEHIISDSKPVQIACFISHLLAIKKSLKSSDNKILLILEEDATLFPNPKLVGLKSAIENKDWEILQLEHNNPETIKRYINLYNKGILLHRWLPLDLGTGSYLIRREFAEKLINYFFSSTEVEKIELKKCYQIEGEIASDQILYDIAKTLVFTFPISYQDLDYPSLIGYEASLMQVRLEAVEIVKKLWIRYLN